MNNNEKIFLNSVYWKTFLPSEHSEEFLDSYKDKINWTLYFDKFKTYFTRDFLLKYEHSFKPSDKKNIYNKLDFIIPRELITSQTTYVYGMSNFPFDNLPEDVDFNLLSNNKHLTESFIVEHIDNLNTEKLLLNGLATFIIEENPNDYTNSKGKIFDRYLGHQYSDDFIKDNIKLFNIKSLKAQKDYTKYVSLAMSEGIFGFKDIESNHILLPDDLVLEAKEYVGSYYFHRYLLHSDYLKDLFFKECDLNSLFTYNSVPLNIVIKHKEYLMEYHTTVLISYLESMISSDLEPHDSVLLQKHFSEHYIIAEENVEVQSYEDSFNYDDFFDDY